MPPQPSYLYVHFQSWETAFRKSRWFTRGWTLQELIAPPSVEFFSLEGKRLGDKESLERQVQGSALFEFSVDERMSWAEKRETKREEDKAYSLLGIFDIYMPLIYGEGMKNAFRRLREEIDKCPSIDRSRLFSALCDLLNRLDQNRNKSSNMGKVEALDARTVFAWFNKHDGLIPRRGPEAVAFLSCLFLEHRPDRVFNLRERRLESIVQQAQCLGKTRLKDLQNWRTSDGVDFASCVERVMAATDSEQRPDPDVTLLEIDEILDRIAATSAFSSVDLKERTKEKYTEPIRINNALSVVFRRLNSSEAKWMVRMLLKNYSPVHVPETLAMQQFHFLLRNLLGFQIRSKPP